MKLKRLYIKEEHSNGGFSSTTNQDLKTEEVVFWVRKEEIIAVVKPIVLLASENDKKIMKYAKETLNKELCSITLENGTNIGNVLVDNVDEFVSNEIGL